MNRKLSKFALYVASALAIIYPFGSAAIAAPVTLKCVSTQGAVGATVPVTVQLTYPYDASIGYLFKFKLVLQYTGAVLPTTGAVTPSLFTDAPNQNVFIEGDKITVELDDPNGEKGVSAPVTVTASSANDTLTRTSHGFANGAVATFGGTTVPGGLTAGTVYYIRDVTANTFKVAATSGGTAIDLTSNGTAVTVAIRYPNTPMTFFTFDLIVDPNAAAGQFALNFVTASCEVDGATGGVLATPAQVEYQSGTFTVLKYINAIADAKGAAAPLVLENSAVTTIDVLANDVNELGVHPTGITVTGVTGTDTTHSDHGGIIGFSSTGVTYQPPANFFGTDTFRYSISYNSAAAADVVTDTGTVTVTVTWVNQTPSFSKGADQGVNPLVLEDTPANGLHTVAGWATNISYGPAGEPLQAVDFIVDNNNHSLFAVQPAIAPNGTLTYTLAEDANGTATVSVQIHDDGGTANGGIATSAAQTFNIIVTPVNDRPSFFLQSPNVTVNEDGAPNANAQSSDLLDAGQTISPWATAINKGAANESLQVLTFEVLNDNNALFLVQPAVNNATTGTLTYTLKHNASGTAHCTVRLHDNGGTANGGVDTSADQTFNITVTPANDIPTITHTVAITSSSDLVDGGLITATVTADDVETAPANLLYTYVWKKNGALPAIKTVTAVAGATTSTLSAVEQGYDAGENFAISVDVTVTDDYVPAASATGRAETYVGNQPPEVRAASAATKTGSSVVSTDTSITDNTALQINEGQSIDFSITFNDRNANDTAHSPADNGINTITWTKKVNGVDVAFSGTAAVNDPAFTNAKKSTASLATDFTTSNITPPNSVIVITATAADSVPVLKAKTWTITVIDVNQVPTFTAGNAVPVLESSAAYSQIWATSVTAGLNEDVTGQVVTFTVEKVGAATDLFSVAPAISTNGTLTFTPAQYKNGTATYNVLAHDGAPANHDSAVATLTINVTAVNDPPVFGGIESNPSPVAEDSGLQTVTNFATDVAPGPAGATDEASQTVHFEVTHNTNAALFSTAPAITVNNPTRGLTGTLTYTPAGNASGTADITVVLKDNGAPVATSAPRTFTITVTPVNDPPVGTATSGFAKFGETSEKAIILTGIDADGAAPYAFYVSNSNAATENDGTLLPTTANATLAVFTTDNDGTLYVTAAQDDGVAGTPKATIKYKGSPTFRGVDTFYFRIFDSGFTGAGEGQHLDRQSSQYAKVTITVGTPLWYPFFEWAGLAPETDLVPPPSWFHVQIWDGAPDGAHSTLVLDTNLDTYDPVTDTRVMSMMPNKYFLAGSLGLTPESDGEGYTSKDYTYRVAQWYPDTNEYGDWLTPGLTVTTNPYPYATVGQVPQYDPPTATAIDAGVDTANFKLSFTPLTAQGYEIDITCTTTRYHNVITQVYRPGDDGSITLDAKTDVIVTLPVSTSPLTYTWKVRGFNPINAADDVMNWVNGTDMHVAAGAVATDITNQTPVIITPKTNDAFTAPNGSVDVILSWANVPAAVSYVVYLAPVSGKVIYNNVTVGDVLTHKVSLVPGLYQFRVIAVDSNGNYSKWSVATSFYVIKDLSAPVITKVTRVDNHTLNFSLLTGSSAPTSLTVYRLDTATMKWVLYPWSRTLLTPWTGDVMFGGDAFTDGDYLYIQAKNGAAANDFNLYQLGAAPDAGDVR